MHRTLEKLPTVVAYWPEHYIRSTTYPRCAFPYQASITAELEHLLKLDILTNRLAQPHSTGTQWQQHNQILPQHARANIAIIHKRHVIPKLKEILTKLHNTTVFSKIDLKEGYHQILLHPDSRHISTFAIHKAIFQYKRLIYGINPA